MEMNMTQQTISNGDPARNKFAVTSLVLSLVSILLSPIILIQILGIIFGIKGLKSEKRRLSITGLVINSLTIVIAPFVIATIAFSMFAGILNNVQQKADIAMANEIEQAIIYYITETNDFGMTFGENEKPTVERITTKLQQENIVNGVKVPALLQNDNSDNGYTPLYREHRGWKIVIDKSDMSVDVSISNSGNSLDIWD